MFDNIVSRRYTNCAKWDEIIDEYGIEDLIPLTVADMDYRIAPEIVNAVIDAANHGIYGYTNVSEKYIELSKIWAKNNYGFCPENEWIVYCPRIIQAISLIIQNYTEKNDKILVFTPLYDPIQNAIRINDRELVECPLILDSGHYEIDFEDFEEKIKGGVKIFISVSPHNPVGRVWSEEEIRKTVEICKRYGVLIISDETHADFIWKNKFISYASYYDIYDNIIIGLSTSKNFNIAGLEASNIIIKNENLRKSFKHLLKQAGIHNPSYFCIPAVIAAYEYGKEWLELAKEKIKENIDFAKEFFETQMKGFKVADIEGTYLLWVDYRSTGISEEMLKDLMLYKAHIAFSLGSGFGEDGRGFFRVNVALPKAKLEEALLRFKNNINWGEIYE
ncbi:MalY/PatB family protein [Lachnoanaerobaculum saburreum]|uniref:cysteine-S-conjugate beta-lyase n=1 Tax=Lachnoanaerobaculum saburreum DSM 3986 TaxID=887325 RepID=E6LP09_9FIRM|nr:MalY/PatB family protein [Lachnoanaerobaculum saburreum]EFU76430.1 aminotransferase, class I/II [Lachnoanaerobaculum saburreum DSM 3986]